ncbi:TPA: hypothetical protein KRW25_000846 [Clostridioides difficile]|nr:hypothetical protein [Clostridioides difficile]HBH3572132.1 hypothetical protein [Clostridioides difficile]
MAPEERPREKMLAKGVKSLSNAELLAILLRTGNKNKNAIELANYIINRDIQGIRHLEDMTIEELIISDVDVSIGTLSSSLVHPREVFKEAIRRSASKIIVMHNHPSGSVEPSREDKNITSRLIKCGEIIGIEIIDHIIIGDGLYFSFKENMII